MGKPRAFDGPALVRNPMTGHVVAVNGGTPLEPKPCPVCGVVHDMTSGADLNEQQKLKPGDISICAGCGTLGVFDENLVNHPATVEVDERLMQRLSRNDPRIFTDVMMLRRLYHMKFNKGGNNSMTQKTRIRTKL